MTECAQTEAHRQAAESIRAHLVCLRGGAPFLSPSDSALLDRWLQEGLTAPVIIEALERAAEARRKRPTKTPFTLDKARRHLQGVASSTPPSTSTPKAHPIADLCSQIRSFAADHAHRSRLLALADKLATLPGGEPEQLREEALVLFRDFHLQAWSSLSETERGARLTRARETLGDLAELLDPEALELSLQEIARTELRQSYPLLTAQTLNRALES